MLTIKPKYYLLLCSLLLCIQLQAQLTANFTIDKAGGCSPLTVQFTNTTSGASANTTYTWDLGNGNTSGLKDAGATYTDEKTYTVTLTATDGANTSVKSQQVTVYRKPAVDISASPDSGCAPLLVTFSSNSTPGDGSIADYYWDFGDGNNQRGASYSSITHTYDGFVQQSAVYLTVTNSYGCYSSISTPKVINTSKAATAAFTANKLFVCDVNSPVAFINKSTGAGTLTYLWDFGDDLTDSVLSPVHTYAKPGIYTVQLTTFSSAGCSANAVKTDYIHVANFSTGFTVPNLICSGANTVITDTSTAGYTGTTWKLDGNEIYPPGAGSNSYDITLYDVADHVLQLTHMYGACQQTQKVTIKAAAGPTGVDFTADIAGNCQFPAQATLKATAQDADQWQWFDKYPYTAVPFATGQTADYTFNNPQSYQVGLKVTNTTGCSDVVWKTIDLQKPNVNIVATNTSGGSSTSGCTGVSLKFAASPAIVKTYRWNFGDGSSQSADSMPVHSFNTPGLYTVTLNYTTTGGCTGTATYTNITVVNKPTLDFLISPGTEICGNSPVTFTVATPALGWNYSWNFGDNGPLGGGAQVVHKYQKDSIFTISLYTNNLGCRDSVKKDVTVKADFPLITATQNTCDGTRGTVTLHQQSRAVTQWVWDFGDGQTQTFDTDEETITHTYTKSGAYQVVLTGVNGNCRVNDTTKAYVLIKQNPVLSANKAIACGSDKLGIEINNVDTNYNPLVFNSAYYQITQLEYGDGSGFPFGTVTPWFTYTNYKGDMQGLESGKSSLRAITQSNGFGCLDTTNYIPLKVIGPTAGFTFGKNQVCFKDPVTFVDNSVPGPSLPIKTWKWDFGDGTSLTQNTGATVPHVYPKPGAFYASLTVTDTAGCFNTTNGINQAISSGPKADFTVSATTVTPNTTVYFSNNSNNYNAYDINYTWLFPGGQTASGAGASYQFTNVGTDTVRLISSNNEQKCVDTAYKIIYVKKINTAFSYTLSYINSNSCPPVIVNFKSKTTNAASIRWDFGDGSKAGNQPLVNHTYNNPGIYRVLMFSYDNNGSLPDSTEDFIEVKGPYAILQASALAGCDTLTVTLSAAIKNASSFTWDFGDGTLKQTTDTFAMLRYSVPGVYTPKLILKDSGGCSGISSLQDKIVVDHLQAGITTVQPVFCDSTFINFKPVIKSIALEKLQLPLTYHWNFGTGNAADTSNLAEPAFMYQGVKGYVASLRVTSAYGCVQTTAANINVQVKSRAAINGPAEICQYAGATFAGTATNDNGALGWAWAFGDSITPQNIQTPMPVAYKDSGVYTVLLSVNNNGCYDTAKQQLVVHGAPIVNILPQLPKICLGNTVQLQGHDAVTYQWSPNENISDVNVSSPLVSPVKSSYYKVHAVNSFGCITNDSVWVQVVQPFKLKADPVLIICDGSTGKMLVSGANTYKWISGTGLSSTDIPNPIVTTATDQPYTVVGYDKDGCFTDTAVITATIKARPTVTTVPHAVTINAGGITPLTAEGSADVVKYKWTPADYLDCATCATTTSAPRVPLTYAVTAYNQYGCTATDSITITILCAENLVHVPNAFTPNGDGHNDRFVLGGTSIKLVKHIVIFGRMGDKLFEKHNIQGDDYANSWDGAVNGMQSAQGVYVYMAEIECSSGETYRYKGTITLVR